MDGTMRLNLPPEERRALDEAKKLALRHAAAHTSINFVACDSFHSNLLIPAIPMQFAPNAASTQQGKNLKNDNKE